MAARPMERSELQPEAILSLLARSLLIVFLLMLEESIALPRSRSHHQRRSLAVRGFASHLWRSLSSRLLLGHLLCLSIAGRRAAKPSGRCGDGADLATAFAPMHPGQVRLQAAWHAQTLAFRFCWPRRHVALRSSSAKPAPLREAAAADPAGLVSFYTRSRSPTSRHCARCRRPVRADLYLPSQVVIEGAFLRARFRVDAAALSELMGSSLLVAAPVRWVPLCVCARAPTSTRATSWSRSVMGSLGRREAGSSFGSRHRVFGPSPPAG